MTEFKSNEVKKVGKVQVSATSFRAIADKLENVFKTNDNVEVDIYIIPSEGAISQIGFDYQKYVKAEEPKVEPKVDEKPTLVEAKPEVKVETPVVAPVVPVKPIEPVTPITPVTPVVAPVTPKVATTEVVVPTVSEEERIANDKTITDNAKIIAEAAKTPNKEEK